MGERDESDRDYVMSKLERLLWAIYRDTTPDKPGTADYEDGVELMGYMRELREINDEVDARNSGEVNAVKDALDDARRALE